MLQDIIKERQRKLNKLRESGLNPYPSSVKRTAPIAEALENFSRFEKSKKILFLVGRLRAWRDQGKIIFADLEDETGRLQIVFSDKQAKQFELLKETFDIGDFIEVSGKLFKTKRGEKSLAAVSSRVISKSLRPLPTEWFGFKDAEERFRRRYLDLILNPEVKSRLKKRSELIIGLRQSLWKEGFLEVETPILQPLPGGAKAKPFKTRWEALKEDMYLRIAPELYLKRLLVGGFEKIFEIGKNFRNEGIDREHYPEFTMLELYWAYQDYKGLMKFLEKLLKPFIPGRWATISFEKIFSQNSKLDYRKIAPDQLDDIFKKEIRPKIKAPTLVTDYPESMMPLAKLHADDPFLTESFQLIRDGTEISKGFSEMNNPVAQREQMKKQEAAYRAGDEESSRLDENFLEALEYGMPPAAGLGIGIDRLAAILTDSHSIREIISFPMLKGKEK